MGRMVCDRFVWGVMSAKMSVWTLQSNKKSEEMTLFSLHQNSNFLGLVPPALWRDPGHCAGGRRGKTEWITHPGKTDAHCGVLAFFFHTISHSLSLTDIFFFFFMSVCMQMKNVLVREDNFWISVSGELLCDLFLTCFGLFSGFSQSFHSLVDCRDLLPSLFILS